MFEISYPRPATTRPKLADLLEMTEEEFRETFRKSPVKRTKLQEMKQMAELEAKIIPR